ncbi:MAG: hypothetical protein HY554_19100 [Elusimicrobia bacterium]|nr:hypothetical protein [Elusimicrobiota bacterium]
MTATAIILLLRTHRLRVFTTADFLTLTDLAPDAATHALERLRRQDLLAKLKKGLWINRVGASVNPYEAVPYLRTPWPAYVSLYSALADYGVVEEIPQVVYAVTAASPKRYKTPIGEFRIHHLPARLMWGYEMRGAGESRYPMAEREKAFLDLSYLALTPRSPLELPQKRGRRWDLDPAKLRDYAERFSFKPLETWLKRERLA